MNITSKTLMTMAAAMAITLTGWAKTLPGVAPMSPEKLAQWRAEEMRINAPKAAAKSDLAFYTGKPYDADLNAYLFPFRNYSPDLCRWTVADPSGFPDGANNYYYAPTPNMGCDPLGLWKFQQNNLLPTSSYGDRPIGDLIAHDLNTHTCAQAFWGSNTVFSGFGTSTLTSITTAWVGIAFLDEYTGLLKDRVAVECKIGQEFSIDANGYAQKTGSIVNNFVDIANPYSETKFNHLVEAKIEMCSWTMFTLPVNSRNYYLTAAIDEGHLIYGATNPQTNKSFADDPVGFAVGSFNVVE